MFLILGTRFAKAELQQICGMPPQHLWILRILHFCEWHTGCIILSRGQECVDKRSRGLGCTFDKLPLECVQNTWCCRAIHVEPETSSTIASSTRGTMARGGMAGEGSMGTFHQGRPSLCNDSTCDGKGEVASCSYELQQLCVKASAWTRMHIWLWQCICTSNYKHIWKR